MAIDATGAIWLNDPVVVVAVLATAFALLALVHFCAAWRADSVANVESTRSLHVLAEIGHALRTATVRRQRSHRESATGPVRRRANQAGGIGRHSRTIRRAHGHAGMRDTVSGFTPPTGGTRGANGGSDLGEHRRAA